jgi:prevent-host-death family protein
MTTISATEARNNIGKLWDKASNGPVTVLSAGEPVAVVLSPAEYEKLTARKRGVKAGFAKHLFPGVDVNSLLETNIDSVFEDYR